MRYTISKDEYNPNSWSMSIDDGKEKSSYGFKGSKKDAYKKFHAILKKDYGQNVELKEDIVKIPINIVDKYGDEKRVFIDKYNYNIVDNKPKNKPNVILIKAIKEASKMPGDKDE